MRYMLALLLLFVASPAWAQAQGGPGPMISPFIQSGATINPLDNTTCLVMPSTATGGCKGPGTLNTTGLFVDGAAVGGIPGAANANTVFAGPTTGSPATPAFRGLVAADIPALSGYLLLAGGTMTGALIGATGSVPLPSLAVGETVTGLSLGTNHSLSVSLNGVEYGFIALNITGSPPNGATGGSIGLGLGACKYCPLTGTVDSANYAVGNNTLGASFTGDLTHTAMQAFAIYQTDVIGDNSFGAAGYGQKSVAVGSGNGQNARYVAQAALWGRGVWANAADIIYSAGCGHGAGFYDVVSNGNTYCGGDAAGAPAAMTSPVSTIQATATGSVMTVTNTFGTTIAQLSTCETLTDVPFTITGGGPPKIAAFGTGGTSGTGSTGTYALTGGATGWTGSQVLKCGSGGIDKTAFGTQAGTLGVDDANTNHFGYGAQSKGPNRTKVGSGITEANVSGYLFSSLSPVTISNAAGVTYTAAQLEGKRILRTGAAAVTDVFPTAAQIVATIPGPEINSGYEFTINNANSGSLTMSAAGATGITLSLNGPTTLFQFDQIRFLVQVTACPACVGGGSEAVSIIEQGRQLSTSGNMSVNGFMQAGSLVTVSGAIVGSSRISLASSSMITLTNSGALAPPTLALGVDNSTTAAGTIKGQSSRAGTDSNVAGGDLTMTAGIGTGTATPSTLNLSSPVAVGSGTGAQTQTVGLKVNRGTYAGIGYTVSTLPASSLTGSQAYVTDQLTTCAVTGAVLTGGGSVVCPVFYNGTAWVGG